MPKSFQIEGPDGQKYMLAAPDDATPEQIRAKAMEIKGTLEKRAATTNMASELGLSLPSNYQGETFTGNLATEAARGFFKGIGGISKTIEQGLGAAASGLGFTETGERLEKEAETTPQVYESELSRIGLTPRTGVGATIGGLLGGAAAYAPFGGPITSGIVAGATDINNEGLLDRIVGGLTGGTIGLGLKGLGRGAEKLLNIKELGKHIGLIREEANKFDPLLGDTYKITGEQLERLRSWHQSLGEQALREGDKLGPIDVNAARDAARTALGEAKGSGAEKDATDALETAARVLSGDKARPDQFVAGGTRFRYDPATGKYVDPKGTSVSDVVANAGAGKPAEVKYSDLRLAQDRLARYLKENKDSSDPGIKAAKAALAAIDARVEEVTPPGTKALEKRQKAFYDEYIGKKYDTPEVRAILEAPSETDRVLKIMDLVRDTKASPEAAKAVADLVGERGREAVSRGMMKEALKAALTRPLRAGSTEDVADRALARGKIDPVKFLRFFDDKPGFGPFKSARFEDMAQGFSKYIKSGDLEAESERVMQLSPKARKLSESGFAGVGLVMSILHGNWAHLAEGMAMAGVEEVGSRILDKAMTDTFGRHLLVAMSKVPEGSPRWMRLVRQFNEKFSGPATAGLTQQVAPAAVGATGVQGP